MSICRQEVDGIEKILERFHLFEAQRHEDDENHVDRAGGRRNDVRPDSADVYVPLLLEHPQTGLQYRTFEREDDLSALLIDAYEIENKGNRDIWYPILPTPCICLYVKYGDAASGTLLCGATTTMEKLRIEPGCAVFCVRFRVGVADFFTAAAQGRLKGKVDHLENLLPAVAALCQEIRRSESFRERVLRVSRYVRTDYHAATYQPHVDLNRGLELIHRSHGMVRVSEVAETIGCSERHLCKMFQSLVGVSTKQYCEIVKLQNSLRDILTRRPKALAKTAAAYGYFDQPHMNRVYQKFLGRTASDMRFFDHESCNTTSIASIL